MFLLLWMGTIAVHSKGEKLMANPVTDIYSPWHLNKPLSFLLYRLLKAGHKPGSVTLAVLPAYVVSMLVLSHRSPSSWSRAMCQGFLFSLYNFPASQLWRKLVHQERNVKNPNVFNCCL